MRTSKMLETLKKREQSLTFRRASKIYDAAGRRLEKALKAKLPPGGREIPKVSTYGGG